MLNVVRVEISSPLLIHACSAIDKKSMLDLAFQSYMHGLIVSALSTIATHSHEDDVAEAG